MAQAAGWAMRLFAEMGKTQGSSEVRGVVLDWTGCGKFRRPTTSRKTPLVVAIWAQRSESGQDPRYLEVIGEEEVRVSCTLGSAQEHQLVRLSQG